MFIKNEYWTLISHDVIVYLGLEQSDKQQPELRAATQHTCNTPVISLQCKTNKLI